MDHWTCRACGQLARVDAWDVCTPCRSEFAGALWQLGEHHRREADLALDAGLNLEAFGEPVRARACIDDANWHNLSATHARELAVDAIVRRAA